MYSYTEEEMANIDRLLDKIDAMVAKGDDESANEYRADLLAFERACHAK